MTTRNLTAAEFDSFEDAMMPSLRINGSRMPLLDSLR